MKNKVTSLVDSYRITLKIVGDQKGLIHKTFLLFSLSYLFQAIGYVLFFPLLQVLFADVIALDQAALWLGLIGLSAALSMVIRWHALNFSFTSELTDISHNLRMALGGKLKRMPLQKLNQYRSGELSSIMAQNVDESVIHLGVVLGMALEVLVVPAVIIAATFFIDPRMAFALLIALPFSYPIYRWSRSLAKEEKSANRTAHANLEADTVEYIQGITVLRSFNQVGENAQKLQSSIGALRQIQQRGMLGAIVPLAVMNTLIEFVFLMMLALGAYWISGGTLSVAALAALLIIVNRLAEPIANFLAITSVLDTMESAFKQIDKLLNVQELEVDRQDKLPAQFDVAFDSVSFYYLGHEKHALKQVSFEIPSNALTAIVGPSGSGKTTVTRLLMRYDDPLHGCVKVGGIDVKNLTQEQLMANISVVFQDVYLFDDSILNNIRMGNPTATDEAVIDAAQKAHCHEFISRLPLGYQTKVGEIGGSLSGGERQRISIARAILKDAPIVILDEPTSALDTESEVAVQNALDELVVDKTVIVIAHRLSTIAHADKILVLEEGEVIEQGSHSQLLAVNGRYASMFAAQQRNKQWSLSNE